MKKLLLICLLLTVKQMHAQDNEVKVANSETSEATLNDFYEFEIPSVINGSRLDPSGFSNVTTDFTNSSLSLKIGSELFYKNANKKYKTTFFGAGNIQANNGIATLYKEGDPPLTYGYSAGFSRVFFHRYWHFTGDPNKHSSEQMAWYNIIAERSHSNYNLFNANSSFGETVNQIYNDQASVFFSIHHYYHSELNSIWQKLFRNITSLGIGYAKTNNFNNLNQRALQEGTIRFNADSTRFESLTKSTTGAEGEFQVFEGLALYGEHFIPLFKDKRLGNIFLGSRITFYALDKDNSITNLNTGLYFNLKDGKTIDSDPGKPSKDVFSLSLTAQFDQLEQRSSENYFDDFFRIQLQLGIPLRFR